MLQQINRRFLIIASAISVGTYLFYIIRKYYIYFYNKSLNKENDLFTSNELLSNLTDFNDVSTASLPFDNLEVYNSGTEEEEIEDLLFSLEMSKHSTSFQNDGSLFSINTTQSQTIYENYDINEYNLDIDSTCSNSSCKTAVDFKTPFLNSSKSII